jgi:hypothetical protein
VARQVNDDFPFIIYHFPFAIGGFNFQVQQSSWLSLQRSEMFIAETARQKELAPEEQTRAQLRARAARQLRSSGAKQQIKEAPAINISPRWGEEAGKSLLHFAVARAFDKPHIAARPPSVRKGCAFPVHLFILEASPPSH